MANVIERITVVNQNGDISYSVRDQIAEIVDASIEYPDAIHFIYHVKDKNGNLLVSIENCPVVVEYESKPAREGAVNENHA